MRQSIDMTAIVDDDPPVSGPAPDPVSPEVARKIADQWEAVQRVALGVARKLTKGTPDANAEAEELVDKVFMALLEGRRH